MSWSPATDNQGQWIDACSCCSGFEDVRCGWPWSIKHGLCWPCRRAWWDGAGTTAEEILAYRAEHERTPTPKPEGG